MAFGNVDLFELCFDGCIAAGDGDDFERGFDGKNAAIQVFDRSDAKAAGQLQNDGTIAGQIMVLAAGFAVFLFTEDGMDWDSGDADVLFGNTPVVKVRSAFGGRGGVAIAWLIDPEAMGFEIGGDGDLREIQFTFTPKARDDLGG